MTQPDWFYDQLQIEPPCSGPSGVLQIDLAFDSPAASLLTDAQEQ